MLDALLIVVFLVAHLLVVTEDVCMSAAGVVYALYLRHYNYFSLKSVCSIGRPPPEIGVNVCVGHSLKADIVPHAPD